MPTDTATLKSASNRGRGFRPGRPGPRRHWHLRLTYPQTRNPPARRHRGPDSRSRPNRETGVPCQCFPIRDLRIGNLGFPVSRFWPTRNRESRIPSPIPGQIGNRGNGNWGFGPLAHGTCQEPLAAAADVRWRPEISIFEDQRQHLAPGGSCLVLT
jgi:hypothetical protein